MIPNKIKKILVPLDGSKNSFRGLDEGIFLARQCGATLTGIFVLDRNPYPQNRRIGSLEKEILQSADKFLEQAKIRSAQNGIDFHKIIAFGEPGSIITHFAQRKKQSLIIIGARGLGGIKEMFLGSVSNYVLHKSKVPVLVVK
jgi:nucleotide-binding universal stress UspA family protein